MSDSDQAVHATAHEAWEARWQTEDGRADWLEPEPEVGAVVRRLLGDGAAQKPQRMRALDLGCGVGRHAIFLAEQGFEVDAIDGSASGVAFATAAAAKRGLRPEQIRLRQGLVHQLPFATAAFDYVLSWNVIYHGIPAEVARAIAEIRRVLRPAGLLEATMLSKRHVKFGQGRAVDRDTFIIDGEEEKDHAHFYCAARGLIELFQGFDVETLTQRENRGSPGSWHWHFTAVREG